MYKTRPRQMQTNCDKRQKFYSIILYTLANNHIVFKRHAVQTMAIVFNYREFSKHMLNK